MSIQIIEGPVDPLARPATSVETLRHVQATVSQRAADAGQSFSHHQCRSEVELVARIRLAKESGADIVLLDPGACSRASRPLRAALRGIGVPYIEVHDDVSEAPEHHLPAGCGPLVAVVSGYAAQSYSLALSMALECLGCPECSQGIGVGT